MTTDSRTVAHPRVKNHEHDWEIGRRDGELDITPSKAVPGARTIHYVCSSSDCTAKWHSFERPDSEQASLDGFSTEENSR